MQIEAQLVWTKKQAPRCWNSVLDTSLKLMGFQQSNSDPCVYTSSGGVNKLIILVSMLMTSFFVGKHLVILKRSKKNCPRSSRSKTLVS